MHDSMLSIPSSFLHSQACCSHMPSPCVASPGMVPLQKKAGPGHHLNELEHDIIATALRQLDDIGLIVGRRNTQRKSCSCAHLLAAVVAQQTHYGFNAAQLVQICTRHIRSVITLGHGVY